MCSPTQIGCVCFAHPSIVFVCCFACECFCVGRLNEFIANLYINLIGSVLLRLRRAKEQHKKANEQISPFLLRFFSSDISFSFIHSSVYRVFARIELDRKHHAIVFKRNKERKRTVDEMDQ